MADLELAVEEAQQRGMLMFELEATRAQATLASGAPSYDWEHAGEALDREAILRALTEFRPRAHG